jgi:hypothetical protein
MLTDIPFSYRVALLAGLMAAAAAFDFWRHGREATRHREYGFVWLAGLLGAAVGFANDCVTSSISPDYFILGKGLEPGNDLRVRAGLYGLKAGLSAGVIGGAVCLFAQPRVPKFSTQQMVRLVRMLWMPVFGALFCGFAMRLTLGKLDPMRLSIRLDSVLTTNQIEQFKRVWWIHTGLYFGLVLGLIALIIKSRRQHVPAEDVTSSP